MTTSVGRAATQRIDPSYLHFCTSNYGIYAREKVYWRIWKRFQNINVLILFVNIDQCRIVE